MRVFKLLSIFIVSATLLSSCKKTSSTPVAVGPTVQYLSASTTGQYAGTLYATIGYLSASWDNSGMHPILHIAASNIAGSLKGSSINFVVNDYPFTTRTLAINDTTVTAQYIHFPTGGGYATQGSLTITSITPYITGTFNFRCTDLTIVSGSLNVLAP